MSGTNKITRKNGEKENINKGGNFPTDPRYQPEQKQKPEQDTKVQRIVNKKEGEKYPPLNEGRNVMKGVYLSGNSPAEKKTCTQPGSL